MLLFIFIVELFCDLAHHYEMFTVCYYENLYYLYMRVSLKIQNDH